MSTDDYDDDDEEGEGGSPEDSGGGDFGENAPAAAPGGIRNWLNNRRGWVIIAVITVLQGVFGLVMLQLSSGAKPAEEVHIASVRKFATDMLGHEVGVKQIYQLIPMRGGKRMTVGLDMVLVLGQLPGELVEGSERPTAEEMAVFIAAIQDMESRVRSRVNELLQRVPPQDWGSVEVYKTIKQDIRDYVNDTLEGLDFGKGVRPGIGKRRVTDVLLPMFVRQFM